MAGTTAWDQVYFSNLQGGPGGAGIMNLGNVGGGTPQAAGALPNVTNSGLAPTTKHFSIPVVVWMFVFLIVGYVGLHVALKAV